MEYNARAPLLADGGTGTLPVGPGMLLSLVFRFPTATDQPACRLPFCLAAASSSLHCLQAVEAAYRQTDRQTHKQKDRQTDGRRTGGKERQEYHVLSASTKQITRIETKAVATRTGTRTRAPGLEHHQDQHQQLAEKVPQVRVSWGVVGKCPRDNIQLTACAQLGRPIQGALVTECGRFRLDAWLAGMWVGRVVPAGFPGSVLHLSCTTGGDSSLWWLRPQPRPAERGIGPASDL